MWGYWLFIAIESLFIHLSLPVDALALNEEVYLELILFNSIVLLAVFVFKYARDKEFAVLITCGFLLRMFFMLWSEYCSHIFTLPNSGTDEFTFYYNAMSYLVKGKEFSGYAQFFSWQAGVFGLSKVFGKFINVLLSISAITVLRRILISLNIDKNVRTITLALACLLPNYGILSALLLRESVVAFLVAVSAYYLVLWWQKGKKKYLIFALAASLGGTWLHSGMVAYTLGISCAAIISQKTGKERKFVLLSFRTIFLSVIISAGVLLVLMNTNIGLSGYFRDAESLADIVSISDAYEDGGSAYNANIVSNDTTLGFIINTPVRMLYFMFAPMPWDWRSAVDIIAFLMSGVFYGYVFFKTIPYVAKGRKYPLISVLFLILLLTLMMFGWGVSNSGTALRHRDKMVIHYLIILALVLNETARERKRKMRSLRDEV